MDDDLVFRVMDDDIGRDDEIGTTTIKISSLIVNNGATSL
jgi:hypothetical protein